MGISSLKIGSLLMSMCSFSLLVTPSSAFIGASVARASGSAYSGFASTVSGHQHDSILRNSGGALLDSSLLSKRSCGGCIHPVAKVWGRNITPTAMLGGGVFGVIREISGSAVASGPLGGPGLFAQGVLLSLLLSAGGLRVREYFVSYGYGLSVASQAAIGLWLFRGKLHVLTALHAAGLVAYGVRLVLFCLWRDSLPSFQGFKERLRKPTQGIPFLFWTTCATLYAELALPTAYALRRLLPAQGRWLGVSQFGLLAMAVGLLVEGVADWQKSHFKKTQPNRFCDRGLYRFCRHPNYLAEVVFWIGVSVAAAPSFVSWYHWLFGIIGPLQIAGIIFQSTGKLEERQAEIYGSSEEYKAYTASTPVLVPGTRQYGWNK